MRIELSNVYEQNLIDVKEALMPKLSGELWQAKEPAPEATDENLKITSKSPKSALKQRRN